MNRHAPAEPHVAASSTSARRGPALQAPVFRAPVFWAAALGVVATLGGCGGSTPAPRSAPAEARSEAHAVALRFMDGGTDENETPRTVVALVLIAPDGERRVQTLRQETGACFMGESSGALLAGRCWWAGFGARYEVRREATALVAYRADQDEETADSEFVEVGRLELDSEALVEIVAPSQPTLEL